MWFGDFFPDVVTLVGAFFSTYGKLLAIPCGMAFAGALVWVVRNPLR